MESKVFMNAMHHKKVATVSVENLVYMEPKCKVGKVGLDCANTRSAFRRDHHTYLIRMQTRERSILSNRSIHNIKGNPPNNLRWSGGFWHADGGSFWWHMENTRVACLHRGNAWASLEIFSWCKIWFEGSLCPWLCRYMKVPASIF